MSIRDDGATTRLKRDFESYLKGEEPSPSELASAPLIENWQARVMRFVSERGSSGLALILVGGVTGHPRLGDTKIRTSQLIWLDRNRNWARTINRVYRLGARASEPTAKEGNESET
jgi:hypothetical protein